jgi:hypothetical protein
MRAMQPDEGLATHVSKQLIDRGRTCRAGADMFELRDENVLPGGGLGRVLSELAG